MGRRRSLLCAWLVLIIFASTALNADTPNHWTEVEIKLTLGEYLQLYFQVYMGHTAPDGGNIYVEFVPTENPEHAILVITRRWHDDMIPTNELQKLLIDNDKAVVENFELNTKILAHAKRWSVDNPAAHLVIRDVSAKDGQKSIAVTLNGKTYFDQASFEKAAVFVIDHGGVWLRSS